MWTWTFADEAGVVQQPAIAAGLDFDTETEAQDWLWAHSAELLDDGITAVSLSDGHQTVYGPVPIQE